MNTIHLQNVGDVPAVPLCELKPGDHIMFNWGVINDVEEITPMKSGKSFHVVWKDPTTKQMYPCVKRGSTLMARIALNSL